MQRVYRKCDLIRCNANFSNVGTGAVRCEGGCTNGGERTLKNTKTTGRKKKFTPSIARMLVVSCVSEAGLNLVTALGPTLVQTWLLT